MGHCSNTRVKRLEETRDWLENQWDRHPDRFEKLKQLSDFCQSQNKDGLKYPLYESLLFFYRPGQTRQTSDSQVAQSLDTTCERIHTARKIALYFLANLAGGNTWQFHHSIIARHDRIVLAYNQFQKRRKEKMEEEKEVQTQDQPIVSAPTDGNPMAIEPFLTTIRISQFTKQVWETLFLLTQTTGEAGDPFIPGSYLPTIVKAMMELKNEYPGFVWDNGFCRSVAKTLLRRRILIRDGCPHHIRGYLVEDPGRFQIVDTPIGIATIKRLGLAGSKYASALGDPKEIIEEINHLSKEERWLEVQLLETQRKKEELKNALGKLIKQL